MTLLHDLTALEAAAAVRRREVSPVELVDHALDRIDRLDGQLGAFVTITDESARAQAKAYEREVLNAAGPLPPLFGVPTAIKDLNLTKGVPTRFGSTVFADFVPDLDDPSWNCCAPRARSAWARRRRPSSACRPTPRPTS